MTFEQLQLIDPILKALKTEGYENPTPIQAQAIPLILKRKDVLGCAQTGTGKTAAFAIPILQILHEEKNQDRDQRRPPIKTLILTPTRELAIQIGESFTAYGRHTSIRHTVIFGGVPQGSQVRELRTGIDILIATPGRLLDLIDQGHVHLNQLKLFVLDEADRMLDMGFVHDVKRVLKLLPAKRQSLFFSATMPKDIVDLADKILVNPEKVEVTPVSSTAETVEQAVYFVAKPDKQALLIHLLKDPEIVSALVFTRTKYGADKVARKLNQVGIRCSAIHGDKAQNARQDALTRFKDQRIRVLVATDIASRGIDVDELSHVINYEIPNVPETYVHRIGRTGRAGASGIAISFCDDEEKAYLRDIHKLIAQSIPVVKDHPYPLADSSPVDVPQPQQRKPAGSKGSSAGNAAATNGRRKSWFGRSRR